MGGADLGSAGRSAQPRSGVDLYLDGAPASLWVRTVVAEKDIDGARLRDIEPGMANDDLDTLNPERSLPTLADREIVLYPARLIVEYLDERYPHPPLMPVEPVSRARLRLLLDRIERKLYPAIEALQQTSARNRKNASRALREELLLMSPVFPARGWALSESGGLRHGRRPDRHRAGGLPARRHRAAAELLGAPQDPALGRRLHRRHAPRVLRFRLRPPSCRAPAARI